LREGQLTRFAAAPKREGMDRLSRIAAVALPLLAAACAPTQVDAPAPVPPPPPPTFSTTGLGSVIGKDARTLEGQFGRPQLDVREGSARKLQFANQVCVLDAYLYPSTRGAEPVVIHIDARYPDGRDLDRASCVESLSGR
jgi:hypothetical protein